MAQELIGDNLKLFSSPWSAPAWMKNSNNLVGGGNSSIKGSLFGNNNETIYWRTYAKYFVK